MCSSDLIAVWLLPNQGGAPLLWFTVGMAAFVMWAHRANIARLLRGEEHRFGRGAGRHIVPPTGTE